MGYVKTNMGQIPLEDYLEIKARQYGFENYKELLDSGYVLELEEESISSCNNATARQLKQRNA